ncbi:MAG: diguanylate cyclase [Oscillatoriales cyanobacterium]|nr:MAG: diguanylate cyclase [Oscillatoriales cyanobacterium]
MGVVAISWCLWAVSIHYFLPHFWAWLIGSSVLAGVTAAWVCSRSLDAVRLALLVLVQLNEESLRSKQGTDPIAHLTNIQGQDDCARLARMSGQLLNRYGEKLRVLDGQRLALESWLQSQADRLIHVERECEQLKLALTAAHTRIEQLEGIDPTTGLANRYRFDGVVQQAWRQALRSHQVLSIVACAIDQPAAPPDSRSPNALEQGGRPPVFESLTRVIQRQAQRDTDLVACDHDGCFLLLLPNTDAIGALAVAESIRTQAKRLFAVMVIPAPNSQPAGLAANSPTASTPITAAVSEHGADTTHPLTLSLGIGTLTPSHQQSPEALLMGARRALERAQRNGGDRIDLDGVD